MLSSAVPADASPVRLLDLTPGGIYASAVALDLAPGLLVSHQIFLNGAPAKPDAVIEKDGHYLVELRRSGPLLIPGQPGPITFTIDRTPPEIRFERPKGLPDGAAPWVAVDDANPDPGKIVVLLDGEPYDRTQPLSAGTHLLEVTAEDRAGNTAYSSESFESAGFCQPSEYTVWKTPTQTLSAAHYFPWHVASAECPANSAWCNCIWGPKPQNPRPARGFYGSNSQSVVNAQLDQLIAHGVDVLSVEWTGNSNETNNLLNRVLPALATRNMKFVLLYDTSIRMSDIGPLLNFNLASIRNRFIADFQLFAASTNYFKHPKYLKFNGRPVVYVYVTRAITGSESNIRNAFTAAYQAAVDNGSPDGLYLVADHLFWGTIDYQKLSWMRPAAATSFAPVSTSQGVSQNDATRPVRAWADKMRNLYSGTLNGLHTAGIVDLTPGVFVQYDDTGLDQPACPNRTSTEHYRLLDGSDWTYMLDQAGLPRQYLAERHIVMVTCNEIVTSNFTGGTGIVWTYSYNEWAEGSGFEELTPRTPAYPFGFGLGPLQILKQKLP